MELEYEAEMAVAEIRQLLRGKPAGIDAIDDDGATIRTVKGADNLQQCRLTGPAGTHDADDLTLVDMEVDALQHLQGAEALGDMLYVDHVALMLNFSFV